MKPSENPLGSEPISALLRRFAVPSVIAMLVSALYNMVDQLFIVINDVRCCTKEKHHRAQKKLNGNAEDHTEDCQHGDGVSNIRFRVLRLSSAHAEIEVCSTADAAEQTDGCADHTERKRYVISTLLRRLYFFINSVFRLPAVLPRYRLRSPPRSCR